MQKKIGIVNYGVGNLTSLANALRAINSNFEIINNPQYFKLYDSLILPGVGNASTLIKNFSKLNFDVALKTYIYSGKPILGICLGMHILGKSLQEADHKDGLGIIHGDVLRIPDQNDLELKVPRVGWFKISNFKNISSTDDRQFMEILDNKKFYFSHSFHLNLDSPRCALAESEYGDFSILSALRIDNIVGVQFHPEISSSNGLKLLDWFNGIS